jgi:hypothetical protein
MLIFRERLLIWAKPGPTGFLKFFQKPVKDIKKAFS